MKSSQKPLKKDFGLSQYYSQLQKYEVGTSSTKKASLKKDYSLTSFSKENPKSSNLAKTHKQTFTQDRLRLGVADKFTSQASFQKKDRGKVDRTKKFSSFGDPFKANSFIGDSLTASNVTYNQWNNESRVEEKENIPFSPSDEEKFTEHCTQLYSIKGKDSIANEIARQINKRDEVYEVVSQQFPSKGEESYSSLLQAHFAEHELMAKIIEQFKSISKLEMEDLSELHYFLKSDC